MINVNPDYVKIIMTPLVIYVYMKLITHKLRSNLSEISSKVTNLDSKLDAHIAETQHEESLIKCSKPINQCDSLPESLGDPFNLNGLHTLVEPKGAANG